MGQADVGRRSRGISSVISSPSVDQAEQAGWPVHRFEDHHLGILTSPVEIADILQDLGDTEEDAITPDVRVW